MNKNSNNQRNAVFSSTLPVLIVLLVIILAFAGKINAGENPGDAQSDSLHELQASSEETGVLLRNLKGVNMKDITAL